MSFLLLVLIQFCNSSIWCLYAILVCFCVCYVKLKISVLAYTGQLKKARIINMKTFTFVCKTRIDRKFDKNKSFELNYTSTFTRFYVKEISIWMWKKSKSKMLLIFKFVYFAEKSLNRFLSKGVKFFQTNLNRKNTTYF